ncbi:MAG: AIM24 family protein, partial [Lachnospiraceae bacterium]
EGGEGMIAFASSFPGSVKAFEIAPGQEMILQKSAFLASESGIELSIHFHKKVGSGLFGGEGFIMQKVSGKGVVFAEFDGHVIEYELAAGQQMIVDTGYLAAMTPSCNMDIQTVSGVKNMVLGGEGIFNTVVTGPGHIWLQTMPISNVAGALSLYLPAGK